MNRFFTAAAAVWGIGGSIALIGGLLLLGESNSLGASLEPYIGGGLMALVGVLGVIVGLIAAVWPSRKNTAPGHRKP